MNGKTPGCRKWSHFSLYSGSFNFSSSDGLIVSNWPICCSMSHHMWRRQSGVLDLCNHSLERIWLLSSQAIVCLCSWNSRGISWTQCTLCKITEQLIWKRKHLLTQITILTLLPVMSYQTHITRLWTNFHIGKLRGWLCSNLREGYQASDHSSRLRFSTCKWCVTWYF